MGNVYSLDSERSLILYHSEKNIFLRSSNGENLTRAVSLCNDYADNLTDVIYHGTIFYAYQNIDQDIIIRSITDQNPYYRISSQDTPDCFQPQLITFQNTLMLFYFVKNPVNDHFLLKCVFPDSNDKKLLFSQDFPDIPVTNFVVASNILLICIEISQHTYLLQIDHTLNCCDLLPNTSLTEQEYSQYEERITALTQKYTQELTTQKEQYSNEISSLTAQHEKELSAQAEQLNHEISKRNIIIDSAKKQYDELMNTAIKYRDEAIKWRNKFVGE